jgi:hypothetical protein
MKHYIFWAAAIEDDDVLALARTVPQGGMVPVTIVPQGAPTRGLLRDDPPFQGKASPSFRFAVTTRLHQRLLHRTQSSYVPPGPSYLPPISTQRSRRSSRSCSPSRRSPRSSRSRSSRSPSGSRRGTAVVVVPTSGGTTVPWDVGHSHRYRSGSRSRSPSSRRHRTRRTRRPSRSLSSYNSNPSHYGRQGRRRGHHRQRSTEVSKSRPQIKELHTYLVSFGYSIALTIPSPTSTHSAHHDSCDWSRPCRCRSDICWL